MGEEVRVCVRVFVCVRVCLCVVESHKCFSLLLRHRKEAVGYCVVTFSG